MEDNLLVGASHLKKSFSIDKKNSIYAVNDVSLEIMKGETLALVGGSGCGKSTLARLLIGMIKPDEGTVTFEGREITGLSEKEFMPYRREMQMVFQDPASSLDPRMTVYDIVAEPLRTWKIYSSRSKMRDRIYELLNMVELKEDCLGRYPHQFSGGQKQRIGIARAIAADPKLIVCDESVSALDVCVQAQILNLLKRLKNRLGLTCLFISHDLSVVSFIADRVCVMKDGSICETAAMDKLYTAPEHEYTKYLLSSIPVIDTVNIAVNSD